jgi:hypothetical protein
VYVGSKGEVANMIQVFYFVNFTFSLRRIQFL